MCIVVYTVAIPGRTQHDWLGRMSPLTLFFLALLTYLLSIRDPTIIPTVSTQS